MTLDELLLLADDYAQAASDDAEGNYICVSIADMDALAKRGSEARATLAAALKAALAAAPAVCGYDETTGICTQLECCNSPAEPVAWVVFNTDGTPEYAAGWRDACHEHIKDVQDANPDYQAASEWVVRPVYAAPQPAADVVKDAA